MGDLHVTISQDVEQLLDPICEQHGLTYSQVVNAMLERYIMLGGRKWRELLKT